MLPLDVTMGLYRDARITGPLAECLGESLFGYQRHRNSNFAGSDGSIAIGPIGRFNISVRAFRQTLRFQQSKFMGSGRSCTQDDLLQSLENVEAVVAVDIRAFPTLRFYPIDSKWLLKLARDGHLTPTGMSASRFDAWMAATFEVQFVAATLPTGAIAA